MGSFALGQDLLTEFWIYTDCGECKGCSISLESRLTQGNCHSRVKTHVAEDDNLVKPVNDKNSLLIGYIVGFAYKGVFGGPRCAYLSYSRSSNLEIRLSHGESGLLKGTEVAVLIRDHLFNMMSGETVKELLLSRQMASLEHVNRLDTGTGIRGSCTSGYTFDCF